MFKNVTISKSERLKELGTTNGAQIIGRKSSPYDAVMAYETRKKSYSLKTKFPCAKYFIRIANHPRSKERDTKGIGLSNEPNQAS